jgi:hypothetical protein
MRVLAVFFFIALTFVITSGCITGGTDRIVGTWEWSDGKGYVERYTFNEDHSFQAEALGSEFSGTWKMITPGHYEVRYIKVNDSAGNETLIESVLYDERSDAIYFPAHRRVA